MITLPLLGQVDAYQASTLVAVALAAFAGAVINAIAGGGTFVTFPTLTGVAKLSEKVANMTSTVGLWPGFAASFAASRAEIARIPRRRVVLYAAVSLIGGACGALLLQVTPTKVFGFVIPWLLAFATIIFAFSKPVARWAGLKHGNATPRWTATVALIQFIVAIYGGYFGAGMGVLMLAGLAFAGLEDIQQMNALKVLLGGMINGMAAVVFVLWPILHGSPDRVNWRLAGTMVIAAIIGGFSGMRLARRIRADHLRWIILLVGVGLTCQYFYKAYFAK